MGAIADMHASLLRMYIVGEEEKERNIAVSIFLFSFFVLIRSEKKERQTSKRSGKNWRADKMSCTPVDVPAS